MGKLNPLFSKTAVTFEKLHLLPIERASNTYVKTLFKEQLQHVENRNHCLWKVRDSKNSSDRMWRTTSTD